MATPFLDVIRVADKETAEWTARLTSWKLFLVAIFIFILLASTSSFLFVFIFAQILQIVGQADAEHSHSGFQTRLFTVLFLWMFTAPFLVRRLEAFLRDVAWKYDDALDSVAMFNSPPGPGASASHLLVLRGANDEASLALAAGSINALLASPVLRLLSIGLLPITIALALSVAVPLLQTMKGYFVALLIIFLLISSFEAVSASCFGRECFISGAMLQIYSNSAPDSVCNVKVLTLPLQRGFRHRLYDHEDCISSIMAWLTSQ